MMIYTATLPLPIPSKKNSKRIIRNRATGRPMILSSRSHEEWHAGAVMALRAARGAGFTPIERCAVEIVFHDPSRRRYDLSNKAESIMDALVDANVITDDDRFCVRALAMRDTGSELKIVEIRITEVTE